MAIIWTANKVNLFVSAVLFVFWYHSPNFLDAPRTVARQAREGRPTTSGATADKSKGLSSS
jgi:hypothetical protein